MKKVYFIGLLIAICFSANAQSFSDDFESYNAGDYLAQNSPDWTTWDGSTGGSKDVKVTSAKAKSGNNSIYLSSALSNGGPEDIVLPFGGIYNSGQFTFEASFFVESGKGAYFNFQGDSVTGNVWALDCHMIEGGTLRLSSGSGTVYLETTYPTGQWFTLKLEIDLSSDTWELFIDNQSKGTFSCEELSIGMLDLFPVSTITNGKSGFYVDDVSFNATPANLQAINGGVLSINHIGGLATQEKEVTAIVRNIGTQDITSFDISVDYNGATIKENVSGIKLTSLDTMKYTFKTPVKLVAGKFPLTVTISNVNGGGSDADNSDDSKMISIDPMVPADGKKVVVEEATGTWCGWCPRGHVYMGFMEHDYPEFFIGIAAHNNDPMVVEQYDNGMKGLVSSYPSALVDRGSKIDPQAIEPDFLDRVVETPAAVMTIGAEYNSSSRELKISLTTEFKKNVSGDWRIAFVLTEDEVSGISSGYSQANYYSYQSQNQDLIDVNGFNWKTLPSHIPASQMVFNHVARMIAPSFTGLPNSFPDNITAGSVYTHDYTVTLNEDWDENNIHIIGILFNPSRRIENGQSAKINDAESNGYTQGTEVAGINEFRDNGIYIYPNPAHDVAFIEINSQQPVSMTITDISGKQIAYRNYGVVGSAILPIQTQNLEQGIYFVKIISGNKVIQKKLLVQ